MLLSEPQPLLASALAALLPGSNTSFILLLVTSPSRPSTVSSLMSLSPFPFPGPQAQTW